jgi:hypothetical protein
LHQAWTGNAKPEESVGLSCPSHGESGPLRGNQLHPRTEALGTLRSHNLAAKRIQKLGAKPCIVRLHSLSHS